MYFTFREVVSEHIIAGPHGALLTVQPSNSVDAGMSLGSTHTLEMLYLRRTALDGTGSFSDTFIVILHVPLLTTGRQTALLSMKTQFKMCIQYVQTIKTFRILM